MIYSDNMRPENLKSFIQKHREEWAMGLTYMADRDLDDPYKTTSAHLDIILINIK